MKIFYSRDGSKMCKAGENWQANPIMANVTDTVFYAGGTQEVAGLELTPVHVTGHESDVYMQGWIGIGPSKKNMKFKAFVDQQNNVYRPATTKVAFLILVDVPSKNIERIITQ